MVLIHSGMKWDNTRLFSVILESLNITSVTTGCRSQWPCCLRRRSAAARLLRLWVRIPPGTLMSICCECCVLSDRGLCDELITRPEESYQMWCVVECDLGTSRMRRPWPALGRSATKKNVIHNGKRKFGKVIKVETDDDLSINPLKPELNPICYLLALLAHHFLHVSRIRVKSLTLRLLMSYIYIYIWSTYSWCF